jgi:hypothetical protein
MRRLGPVTASSGSLSYAIALSPCQLTEMEGKMDEETKLRKGIGHLKEKFTAPLAETRQSDRTLGNPGRKTGVLLQTVPVVPPESAFASPRDERVW